MMNKWEYTTSHRAIQHEDTSVTKLRLENNARPHVQKRNNGDTAPDLKIKGKNEFSIKRFHEYRPLQNSRGFKREKN